MQLLTIFFAIELARLTGDLLWHAGAIEGRVCALVLEGSGVRDEPLETEVVHSLHLDVIQFYHRATALTFELEATLKLARFLCKKEMVRHVVELITDAVEGTKSLMDASDRLVANVEAARIFDALGYKWKAALYAQQVALLYKQQNSHWAAVSSLQVMSVCALYYRCEMKSSNFLVDGQDRHVVEWCTLQIDVHDMLAAAVCAGDALAA